MFNLGRIQIADEVVKEMGNGDVKEAFRALKPHIISHGNMDWSKYEGVSKFSYSSNKRFTLWFCTEFDNSTTKVWLIYKDKKDNNDEQKPDENSGKPDQSGASGTAAGTSDSNSMALQSVGGRGNTIVDCVFGGIV